MTLSIVFLSTLSLIGFFLPNRMASVGNHLVKILSLITCLIALVLRFKNNVFFNSDISIFCLLFIEVFIIFFVSDKKDSSKFAPAFVTPLLRILFLATLYFYSNANNIVYFILIAILADYSLSLGEHESKEVKRQTFLFLVLFFTLIFVSRFDKEFLTFSLVGFIYWLSSGSLPFGVSKNLKSRINYSLCSRLCLYSLFKGFVSLNVDPHILFLVVILNTLGSLIVFLIVENTFKNFFILKKANEINLILIGILCFREFKLGLFTTVICYNIFFFLPGAIRKTFESERVLGFSLVLSFLLINGIFLGPLSTTFKEIFFHIKLAGLSENIMLLMLCFWSMNSVYMVKYLKRSKELANSFSYPIFFILMTLTSIIVSL